MRTSTTSCHYIYATQVNQVLRRITQQTNKTRGVNRNTTTKENIRSILKLLGGHKVSFDTSFGQSMCVRTTFAAMLSYTNVSRRSVADTNTLTDQCDNKLGFTAWGGYIPQLLLGSY
eukprot:scaffold2248_cov136-Skeletonema_dohrnii-CCMP3373.AAC.4